MNLKATKNIYIKENKLERYSRASATLKCPTLIRQVQLFARFGNLDIKTCALFSCEGAHLMKVHILVDARNHITYRDPNLKNLNLFPQKTFNFSPFYQTKLEIIVFLHVRVWFS